MGKHDKPDELTEMLDAGLRVHVAISDQKGFDGTVSSISEQLLNLKLDSGDYVTIPRDKIIAYIVWANNFTDEETSKEKREEENRQPIIQ